jgi:hypothetical protein
LVGERNVGSVFQVQGGREAGRQGHTVSIGFNAADGASCTKLLFDAGCYALIDIRGNKELEG